MPITVPPVPDDLHPSDCWRRVLTGLDPQAVGGYRAKGEMVGPGDIVEAPEGTLLLAVDKATRGFEDRYRGVGRYAVKDATVTVYLTGADGVLSEVWSRQYMQAKSAFGQATMKKLDRLLQQHPAPAGDVTVVREARRPNWRAEKCRWCKTQVAKERGHVVGHGEQAQVEHYEQCPTTPAKTGEVCALCGVEVVGVQAARHHRRDGEGGTEVRHDLVGGKTCLEAPVKSAQEQAQAQAEQQRAQWERFAQERREQQKKEEAKRKRAQARADKKQAEHDAEQARVAGLETVSRESESLFDKGLGGGMRACLMEHTDTLSDGTTTLRWTVETYREGGGVPGYGEDGDDSGDVTTEPFTSKDLARIAYQGHKFEPDRRSGGRRGSGRRGTGRACDECGGRGATVERCDSSGIPGVVCTSCDREYPDDFLLSFC
ncbi:hypothetical protein ACWCV5_32740 [Streptomyces tubercidicus]